MKNFMFALNENNSETVSSSSREPLSNGEHSPISAASLLENDRKQGKKDILGVLTEIGSLLEEDPGMENKIVNSFTTAVTTASEELDNTPGLREATATRKTPTGFIYGEWELIERADVKKTYYTIRHTGTSEILAKDLLLRESALAIVKMLNEGRPINSTEAFRALNADMAYRSALFDMAALRRKKGPIIEDRYEKAKSSAIRAKETANLILENLRGIYK